MTRPASDASAGGSPAAAVGAPRVLVVVAESGILHSVRQWAPELEARIEFAPDLPHAAVEPGLVVRLVHKPTGKPVSDAVIFSPRIDMSPEGMATMTAPATPVAEAEPGTYGFKTDLVMAGRWLLTLSAKVQGEQETVSGKITFKAAE